MYQSAILAMIQVILTDTLLFSKSFRAIDYFFHIFPTSSFTVTKSFLSVFVYLLPNKFFLSFVKYVKNLDLENILQVDVVSVTGLQDLR